MIRHNPLFIVVVLFCFPFASAFAQPAPELQVREGNALSVSIEENILCILSIDGVVTCETASFVAPFVPPEDLGAVETLTLGKAHACVIEVGGNVRCFGNAGSNFFGQLDVPDEASPAIALDSGAVHSCAINTQGQAICWGLNANNRATPPAGDTQYVDIATGEKHSCAVTADGELVCWGAGNSSAGRIPQDLPPVQSVSASRDETCVLTQAGDISCFNGGIVNQEAEVPTNGPYSSLTHAGGSGSGSIVCGLDASGMADCVVTPINIIFDPDFEPLAIEKLVAEARALAIAEVANEAGPFISIDTAAVFLTEPDFLTDGPDAFQVFGCGVRADGAVACWQTPDGIVIQAEQQGPGFVPTVTAQVYSPTTVELFWQTPGDLSVGNGPSLAFYEVFRNGEFYANSYGRSGFYDNSLDRNTDYTYEVRLVSGNGDLGDLSALLSVTAESRTGNTPVTPGPGDYQPADQPFAPANLQALVYGASTLELIWDRTDFTPKVYEIWVNGEFTGSTTGTSYILRDLLPDTAYRFDVVAVKADDDIGGYSVVSVELGDPLQCL